MTSITKQQARKLAVAASLNGGGKGKGKQAALGTVQHLGYVQIDTISVIERAHHHVFWSRQGDYKPEYLNQLLSEDRAVFEQWAHAVAYMPIEDYRYYLPKIEASRKLPTAKWQKLRYQTAKPLLKGVLKRIRDEGPLASKDFEHVKKGSTDGWWQWKPAKMALDILYTQGDLMISSRRNFQRVFDLTERVLPEGIDITVPSPEECAEHQIKRTLTAMGLAREAEIVKHLQLCDRKVLKAVLQEMVIIGKVTELNIRGIEDDVYYIFPEVLVGLGKLRIAKQLRILSPFDNMIIQRERMRLLFDFDYTIECYVPAPKRKFGYFVCPILWGSDLVARIDMKADRKTKTLIVQSLHYESALKDRKRFEAKLNEALKIFAKFNGCDEI
jgi:uncharacterized protein YcaQ